MSAASRDLAGADYAAAGAAVDAAMAVFKGAGFAAVEPGSLLEAENLLDLYGEDVRSRAFVFAGEGGDLCLRPDLTLPLCRLHLSQGAEEARYAAAGPVFRRPSTGEARPSQFLQIGCEWFGGADVVTEDAAIFALTHEALRAHGPEQIGFETGDLGVLFALIDSATIPERWRTRLKRHIWRPARFHTLLEGFAGESEDDPGRVAFLKALGALEPEQARAAIERMLAISDTTHVGLRTPDEIAARFLEQAEDARAHPLPVELVQAIEAAVAIKAPSDVALTRLRDLAKGAGLDIGAALARFESRLEALDERGFAPENLPFSGEFGRNLEYYDGFVFEFFHPGIAAAHGGREAQLAGGGRYDGMVQAAADAFGLAAPNHKSAIGAAIRPEAALRAMDLEEGER